MEGILTLELVIRCRICKKEYTIGVNHEDYKRFVSGDHVKNCFPYLNSNDHELLISETCGECFDKMFATDEEEEDA